MRLSGFRYLIPEAAASMKKNVVTTFAAVTTVTIALFLCAMFFLVGVVIDLNATEIESGVDLTVLLDDGVSPTQIENLQSRIGQLEGVREVKFVSKQEALERLDKRLSGALYILEGEVNPLPDAFSVFTVAPEYLVSLQEQIAALEGVQLVRGNDDETVEKFFAFTAAMRKADFVVMCLLGLAAAVLISMNIRIAVYARQKEVMIKKWIGASNWFIRWPFLLEGIFVGALGALLASASCLYLYSQVGKYLQTDLSFILFLSVGQVWLPVTALLLAVGVVIGGVGSAVSVGRFLDV